MNLWSTLSEELVRFRDSKTIIKQCLDVYENSCASLIEKIGTENLDESQENFDKLFEIQSQLAIALYKYEFPMSERLKEFIYHFDRNELHSRKFWHGKFKNGETWPS